MEITRYQDDDGKRHYVSNGVDCLSVTTVLGELDESKKGLDWWKRQNNGKGDNADWRHLFWYKTYRGTLCHYQALVKFNDVFDGDTMWGEGEAEAMQELMAADKNERQYDGDDGTAVLSTPEDVKYSVLKDHGYVRDWYDYHNKYESHTLMDIHREDVAYFVDAFDEICEKLGITEESVIRVEQFMLNDEVGYGGQCDLLYEDPDGKVVVADLKTSSGLRQKHRLQSVAYAKAVEQDDTIDVDEVDRVEVIRIHPDTETWEVHSHEAPTEHHTTEYWYKDKYGEFEYDSNEEMWEIFKELSERAQQ